MKFFKSRRARWGARLVLYPLLVVVMLRWFEHKSVFQPSALMETEARDLGRPSEDVYVPVDKNGRVEAWFFPSAPGAPAPQAKVFLVCHGNAGNISHRLDLCALLLETGASALVFDYDGYGRSAGSPSEEGTYRDAQAVFGWLRQKGFAAANITAYGESLGGGVAAELALREPVGGLVLQSTFTSIPDLGSEMLPWLPVRWIGAIKYDTHAKLPRLKIPVLVIHSREDTMIGYHHGENNFAAANEPKFFCEIRGDHNDCVFTSRKKVLDALRGFVQGGPGTARQ